MSDWIDPDPPRGRLPRRDDLDSESRVTFRQLVIRFVALLLLASFLGGLWVTLRGIEDILVVIGILLAVALVARLAKKQRDAENPYDSDRPSDLDIQ